MADDDSLDVSWLPTLIPFSWEAYQSGTLVEKLYHRFGLDFGADAAKFKGKAVKPDEEPRYSDKWEGFWHLTTETNDCGEREPVESRCERIAWARALIDSAEDGTRVCCWAERTERKHPRWHLTLLDYSYLVVLEEKNYVVRLVTAYPIERANQREKYRKRHARAVAEEARRENQEDKKA